MTRTRTLTRRRAATTARPRQRARARAGARAPRAARATRAPSAAASAARAAAPTAWRPQTPTPRTRPRSPLWLVSLFPPFFPSEIAAKVQKRGKTKKLTFSLSPLSQSPPPSLSLSLFLSPPLSLHFQNPLSKQKQKTRRPRPQRPRVQGRLRHQQGLVRPRHGGRLLEDRRLCLEKGEGGGLRFFC
jgi:hypothetical protein